MPAPRWQCGSCNSTYAVYLSRCPRCHGPELEEVKNMPKISKAGGVSVEDVPAEAQREGGVSQPVVGSATPAPEDEGGRHAVPGDPAAASGDAEGADTDPEVGPVRPKQIAPKGDHAAYAAAVYGRTADDWDDEYSKKALIEVLDQLEAGEKIVSPADRSVVDAPDPHEGEREFEGDGIEKEGIELAVGETGELTGDGTGTALPEADENDPDGTPLDDGTDRPLPDVDNRTD